MKYVWYYAWVIESKMLLFSSIGTIRYRVFNYQPKYKNTIVQLNVQGLLFKWLSNVHICGNFFTIRFDLQPDYFTEISMLEAIILTHQNAIFYIAGTLRTDFLIQFQMRILWICRLPMRTHIIFTMNEKQIMVKYANQAFQMDHQIILLLGNYCMSFNVLEIKPIISHRSILIVFSK